MLVVNHVFIPVSAPAKAYIIAKSTVVSLGLEFVFAGKVNVKGKMYNKWSLLRPKLHTVCQELLAEVTKHFDNTAIANQDPQAIGSALLQVLEKADKSDDDDASKTWILQLDALPTLKATVTDILNKNDFNAPWTRQSLYLNFVADAHSSIRGALQLKTAQDVLLHILSVSATYIPATVVDFAAAAVEAALANGGSLPDGLIEIFNDTKQAQFVAMSRTAFVVHALPGIISTLPEATKAPDCRISALASFASVVSDNPLILAQLAACEAMASSCDDDAQAFQTSVADSLEAGKEYTKEDAQSIISKLQGDTDDVDESASVTRGVKEEVHTPAAARATSSQSIGSAAPAPAVNAANKMMSF